MKALIIEDDMNKAEQISNHLHSILSDIQITCKKSYQSGLREIIEERYDLIILDMSLPTYDISMREEGGPFLAYAGEEVLGEMQRRRIRTNVIVVTQFNSFGEGRDKMSLEQLRKRLSDRFKENYIKTTFYEASEKNWKDEISLEVKSIVNQRKT